MGGIGGPAFVEQRADDGALHRPAHAFPGNWRSRVQDHPVLHAGEAIACDADAFQHWGRGAIGRECLLIGLVDLRMSHQAREALTQRAIALRRRGPVKLGDACTRCKNGLAERRDADIDYMQRLTEQILHRVAATFRVVRIAPWRAMIEAASRTAAALLAASCTPAARSVLSRSEERRVGKEWRARGRGGR